MSGMNGNGRPPLMVVRGGRFSLDPHDTHCYARHGSSDARCHRKPHLIGKHEGWMFLASGAEVISWTDPTPPKRAA